MTTHLRYWQGEVPRSDDFGHPITDQFIDGKSIMGPCAFFTPDSWAKHGVGRLGQGYGQRYERQDDGRFQKVEG